MSWFRRWWQQLRGRPAPPLARDPGEKPKCDPGEKSCFRGRCRPYIRWWWLRGPFSEERIRYQLDWLADHGFGGVELAWLHPAWLEDGDDSRPEWLGQEWTRLVACAKRYADEIGLGCDFTFGSCWPFGGRCVRPEDAAQTLEGLSSQRLHGSWEEPHSGFVLDHLSARALQRYFDSLSPAFRPALEGTPSALFCDSLEIHKNDLWNDELWGVFERRFGYRLPEHTPISAFDADVKYDLKTLVGETIRKNFYEEFTRRCHELGAISRVQCHGAPTDLLSAYASVDIPESETLLFNPYFSRIPASAAALADKPVVSCETFTCLYGFPRGRAMHQALSCWRREQVEDLELLAGAVLANGVNQIVWHGMPFNGPDTDHEFYASVHVGPDCVFADRLPALNRYLERACEFMRSGSTLARLAVYLPNEDMMIRGPLPESQRVPGAVDSWEMRDVRVPAHTEGHAPVWISAPHLAKARVEGRVLICGSQRIPALYVDVQYIDGAALVEILRLARDGLPVILCQTPKQPGHRKDPRYSERVAALHGLPQVVGALTESSVSPLVESLDQEPLPPFWARRREQTLLLFFAHPGTRDLVYPMPHGAGKDSGRISRGIRIHWHDRVHETVLVFEPAESVLLGVSTEVSKIDLGSAAERTQGP